MTTALYGAGYGSSSRYMSGGRATGYDSMAYRRGGSGVTIRYDVMETPVGRLLVGATEKGVCAVQFGDSEQDLAAAYAANSPPPTCSPIARS